MCSVWDSAPGHALPTLDLVRLFPLPAARRYVGCPRCGLPYAFVTLTRVETQSSFCPVCRCLWETARGGGEPLQPSPATVHS
jgi:hypothetical protein